MGSVGKEVESFDGFDAVGIKENFNVAGLGGGVAR